MASVRHHVIAQGTYALPNLEARRSICALSVVAWALLQQPEKLDEAVLAVAPQADLDLTLLQNRKPKL